MTDISASEPSEEFVRRFWIDDGSLPKHERLKRAFITAISEGFWQPGARLPSESELAAVTPCSLGTVQKALRDLAGDGLIERKRGSGTVVARLGGPIEEPWHMRFFDEASAQHGAYLSVFNHVLHRAVTRCKGPWSAHIGQNDAPVVRIDRCFVIDSRFQVHAVFYALADRFPELVETPERMLDSTNFKLFIGRRYRIPVRKVRQSLRFEHPSPAVAETTRADPDHPMPVLSVVAYALGDEPVYYQDFYIPPSEFQLDLGVDVR